MGTVTRPPTPMCARKGLPHALAQHATRERQAPHRAMRPLAVAGALAMTVTRPPTRMCVQKGLPHALAPHQGSPANTTPGWAMETTLLRQRRRATTHTNAAPALPAAFVAMQILAAFRRPSRGA